MKYIVNVKKITVDSLLVYSIRYLLYLYGTEERSEHCVSILEVLTLEIVALGLLYQGGDEAQLENKSAQA